MLKLKTPVYLYQRFSSDTQAGNSSIYRQGKAQEDWLAEHHETHELVDADSYRDEGLSGYSGKHLEKGALGRLVAEIEQGIIPKHSVILVEHFSRFSRMDIDRTEELIKRIWKHDISIVTARDNKVYSPNLLNDAYERIRLVLEIEKANKDSEYRSQKVKGSYDARKKRAKEGIAPRLKKPFWLDQEGRTNEYADIVRVIFELHAKAYGQIRIERELRARFPGAPPLKNVNPTKIMRILKSAVCIGEVWGHKVYEPVVSENTFYRAQEIQQERLFSSVREARKWPLHGIVKCGHCGSGTSIQQQKNYLPLLRCSMRRRSGGERCDSNPTFPYTVAHYFFKFFVEPMVLKFLSDDHRLNTLKIELIKLRDKLRVATAHSGELNALYDMRKSDGKSIYTILEKLEESQQEVVEIQGRIKKLEARLNAGSNLNTISAFVLSKTNLSVQDYNAELLKSGYRILLIGSTLYFSEKDNENNPLCSLEYLSYNRADMAYRYEFQPYSHHYPTGAFGGKIFTTDYPLEHLLNPNDANIDGNSAASAIQRIADFSEFGPKLNQEVKK